MASSHTPPITGFAVLLDEDEHGLARLLLDCVLDELGDSAPVRVVRALVAEGMDTVRTAQRLRKPEAFVRANLCRFREMARKAMRRGKFRWAAPLLAALGLKLSE